jgi:hypothetical protein
MISENQIISIYCDIYDFCKELDGYVENELFEDKYIDINFLISILHLQVI